MARKKLVVVDEQSDQKSKFKDLFDNCPYSVHSSFEQEHFGSTTGAGYARYVIGIINRIRKLESDLETETRNFERNLMSDERNSLYEYLESQDPNILRNTVDSWEQVEREYWVNTLGKQAAIELITLGRTSQETMSKMVRLPEDLYIKVTQICVRLANTIKETTVRAEQEIGVVQEDTAAAAELETAPTKRKINLKNL